MLQKLIPPQFQIYVLLAGIAATFAAGWAASAYINGLQHKIAIGLKNDEIDRLDKELLTQNAAVALLGEQKAAAIRARNRAEAVLKDQLASSAKRQSAADKIVATDCSRMIEELKRIGR